MVKDSKSADKTNKILEVAQSMFARFGLAKTSMNEIAAELGISKASLYYYFTDKESIFKEVVRKEQLLFIAQVEDMIARDIPASRQLVLYVKKRTAMFKDFVNLGKLNAETLKSAKPIFSELAVAFRNEELRLVSAIISKGIREQEFSRINISEHAELFVELLQSTRSNFIVKHGSNQIAPEAFKTLEHHMTLFAKLFSQGITKLSHEKK